MKTRDVATAIPGVHGGVRYGGLPDLWMRGFTTDDLAVFNEGLNLPIGQNLIQANADAFHYAQIHALKGPSSVLYGQGAIGGAIHYVSKTPAESFGGETFLTYSTWDKAHSGSGLAGPLGIDGLYGRFDASRLTDRRYPNRTDRDGEEQRQLEAKQTIKDRPLTPDPTTRERVKRVGLPSRSQPS